MKQLNNSAPQLQGLPNTPNYSDQSSAYQRALSRLLRDTGMTETELELELDKIAEERAQGKDHLEFDEIQDLDSLPADRHAHLDSCRYCQELVDVCSNPVGIPELAKRAAEQTQASRPSYPSISRLAMAACMAAVIAAGAFAYGQYRAEARYARYETSLLQLDTIRSAMNERADPASSFREARVFSDSRLEPQAKDKFIQGLRADNLPVQAVARVQNLLATTDDTGWFEKTTARTQIAIQQHLDPRPKSSDGYLRLAQLQMKAGRPTEGYINILSYLSAVNARPTSAEAFLEAPVEAKAAPMPSETAAPK